LAKIPQLQNKDCLQTNRKNGQQAFINEKAFILISTCLPGKAKSTLFSPREKLPASNSARGRNFISRLPLQVFQTYQENYRKRKLAQLYNSYDINPQSNM